MQIKDKNIFIAGGSSGLGLSLTKAFISKGAKVYATGTKEDNLSALKKIDSPNIYPITMDVQNSNNISKVIDSIDQIDVFINCVGVWTEGKLPTNTFDQIKNTIDINLTGAILLTNKILPKLVESKGFVFHVVSTSGIKARSNQSVYVASKFGLRGFIDSLRDEMVGSGVRVVGLYPGGMNTPFFQKSGTNMNNQKWMDTNHIADTIIHILENDQTLTIDHVIMNRLK